MAAFAAKTSLSIPTTALTLLCRAQAISARSVAAQALSKAAYSPGEDRSFTVTRSDVIGLIALAGSAAYLRNAGVIDGIDEGDIDFTDLMYSLNYAYDFLSASDQETADCEYENNYLPATEDMI